MLKLRILFCLFFVVSLLNAMPHSNNCTQIPDTLIKKEKTALTLQDSIRKVNDSIPLSKSSVKNAEKKILQVADSIREVIDTVQTTKKVQNVLPPVRVPVNVAIDTIPQKIENKQISSLQLDSITVAAIQESQKRSSFKPNPKKAVIYSLILPGLGQVYNNKYWKLPILYGGYIGFTYAISWNNKYYKDYMEGYKSIMDEADTSFHWHKFLRGADPEKVNKKRLSELLRDRKNYFRYYRDLSIIGTVALYILATIDAYVDAQLFDFDMSQDLSIRIAPAIFNKQTSNALIAEACGVQINFTF